MQWACSIVLAVPVVVATSPTMAQQSQITMRDVIENVRANEQLYRNIEVQHSLRYDLNKGKVDFKKGSLESSTQESRCVLQGNLMYYSLREKGSTTDGKASDRAKVRGYDGEKTRFVENGALVNIRQG
jgi:hypothetical protein